MRRAEQGRTEYGDTFKGDPSTHLRNELLDALFYIYAHEQSAKQSLEDRPLDLSYLANACYNNAVEKGFHDEERSFGDEVALIHSEVSEALEEYRKSGNPTDATVVAEFADIIIRVCDTAGRYGIDLDQAVKAKMSKNRERPHRHGGKHL